ncbi:MAG: DUF2110 family protein [Candidatus Heimdallarchaeota archaeon]
MQKIRLSAKIYSNKTEVFRKMKHAIHAEFRDLTVTIDSMLFDEAGYVTLELSGEDEVVAYNYLKKIYGESKQFDVLKVGDTLKGYIVSSGKVGFGLFVDIGIKLPYDIDALIPLFSLRKQLCEDKKIPTRKIIDSYGLINNLPLEITIEKASIGLKKIEARLSDKQVELFSEWVEEGLDKLYILGAFEAEINDALYQTKHDKDIIKIEKLGWIEHIISCKFNTSAKGLIPSIGKKLPKARFEIFSPGVVNRMLKDK